MIQNVLEHKYHFMSIYVFAKTHLPRLHLIRTVAPLDTILLRLEVPIPDILWDMEMLEVHDSDPLTRQDPWAIFNVYFP